MRSGFADQLWMERIPVQESICNRIQNCHWTVDSVTIVFQLQMSFHKCFQRVRYIQGDKRMLFWQIPRTNHFVIGWTKEFRFRIKFFPQIHKMVRTKEMNYWLVIERLEALVNFPPRVREFGYCIGWKKRANQLNQLYGRHSWKFMALSVSHHTNKEFR